MPSQCVNVGCNFYMRLSQIQKYKQALSDFVKTRFEKKLLNASLKNLSDNSNKFHFNNFAYGIRELSRHVLDGLAPLKEVEACPWYKNITGKKGQLSRSERIKYAIQGGLPDKVVSKIFNLEKESKAVLKAIDILNTYTHVNEKTFDLKESEVLSLSHRVVDAFSNFVNVIEKCRERLISKIEDRIYDLVMDYSVSDSLDSVAELSTHYSLESAWINDYHITKISSHSLSINAEGCLNTILQFGSNSDVKNDIGAELEMSFPFACLLTMEITEDFPQSDIEVIISM